MKGTENKPNLNNQDVKIDVKQGGCYNKLRISLTTALLRSVAILVKPQQQAMREILNINRSETRKQTKQMIQKQLR